MPFLIPIYADRNALLFSAGSRRPSGNEAWRSRMRHINRHLRVSRRKAGRSFAVVADEVRKLAKKPTASTNDVGNAIKSI